jgi:hypothetical protein
MSRGPRRLCALVRCAALRRACCFQPPPRCTQLTCFTSAKVLIVTLVCGVYKQSTNADAAERHAAALRRACCVGICTLVPVIQRRSAARLLLSAPLSAQFTCFTSTNVQILTQLLSAPLPALMWIACVTNCYLLYWYNSTNTDAALRRACC